MGYYSVEELRSLIADMERWLSHISVQGRGLSGEEQLMAARIEASLPHLRQELEEMEAPTEDEPAASSVPEDEYENAG